MGGLLIVTCGTTDLQPVVQSSSGKRWRVAVARHQQRGLHELLLHGALEHNVDPDAETLPFRDDVRVGLEADTPAIIAESPAPEETDALEVATPLRFAPAKLSGLASVLKGNDAPDTVVVFNTHRSRDQNEPIAAGRLLSAWLAREFALEPGQKPGHVGVGLSGWANFLDGDMLADGPEGAPVNRNGVQRMEDTLRGMDRSWKHVTLAITGGIPTYREQVRALTRFLYPRSRISEFVQPQREPGRIGRLPNWALPSDSYRLRGEVRERVIRGDFIAAAALAERGRGQGRARWPRPVALAAKYLNGTLDPADDLPGYLAALVGPGTPRCLLQVMRTESAIRARRLPEAVLWTFAFFDAALIDAIAAQPYVTKLDDLARTVDIDERLGRVPGALTREVPRKPTCLSLMEGQPEHPTQPDIRRYRYFSSALVNGMWLRNLGDLGRKLEPFERRLDNRRGLQPKSMRNVLAHSTLSAERMQALRDRFVELGIWNSSPEASGFFVGQREVEAVVTALGLPAPLTLHRKLIEGLRRDIESHRFA